MIDSFNEKNTIIYGNFTFTDNFYTTWLIDGNKKGVSFKDILFDYNEKKSALYLTTFKEYYDKSSLVFYGNTFYYYFYFQAQWLRLERKNIDNLKKNYPEKVPPPRLISMRLNPNPPDYVKQFYVPRKKVGSISDAICAPKDFTLGTYIIRVGLPGGDSLVYRRFGDGVGNLSTFYQRPTSEGGNDSIIFIEQDYHNNKMIDGGTYFSDGGLFMIKPKRSK